jgi:lysophospholipase L1-like esterase
MRVRNGTARSTALATAVSAMACLACSACAASQGRASGSTSAGATTNTTSNAGSPANAISSGGTTSIGRTSSNAGTSSAATSSSGVSTSIGTTLVPGGLRWVGRVDASNPSAVKFAWSGSGFVGVINGTKISVSLLTEGNPSAFFQPVIDGKAGARFSVSATTAAQTVVLADRLPAGDHVVELYRETEGMYGDTVFGGVVDGTVKGAPAASGRLIEIVGDSISAGYGNLGVEVHPPWDNTCTFSVDSEAWYQSYGAMIGRDLNAEVSDVARSGWGMYRDLGGSTANTLPSVYANTVGTLGPADWAFTRKPDAVLVNLGTNDVGAGGDPGAPFETAYVSFLGVVRGHYPSAWIFLTMGPMTSDPELTQMRTHLANVVTTFADPRVVTIDLDVQDVTSTGCDYHPNVAEDRVMATALTTAIRAKLGW